ncbi:MAG: hypothetical protein ACE14P_10355 [Methanotrichaceae archaeon]
MAEDKMSLSNINDILSKYNVQCLEGITLEGDVEIEVNLSGDMGSGLNQALGSELTKLAMHLLNFSKSMGYPAESMLRQR